MAFQARPHRVIRGVEHKHCGSCARAKPKRNPWRPITEFHSNVNTHDGLRYSCKLCANAVQKARYRDVDGVEQRDRVAKRETSNRAKESAQAERVIAAADKLTRDQLKRDEKERADEEKTRAAAERKQQRINSDFDELKPEDFDDLSVGNSGSKVDKALSREANTDKQQLYNRKMGRYRGNIEKAIVNSRADGNAIADHLPREDGEFMAGIAEQNRRFQNRRVARSISIFAGVERDAIEQSIAAMQKYMSGRITPTGYAAKPKERAVKRTVCCLLSDLHLGSDLSGFDEPQAFGAVEEARRLEHVLRQFCDYKPQYREQSEALLILNGDLIEGQLMHDFRSGAPLTEQKMIFQSLMGDFLGHVAAQFPSVRVVCQPGNHGRDKVRHPGRATARKWDGHETEMYHGLRAQCRDLKNVKWQIDFRAISMVDLYGSVLGVTHGDTDVKLGHPDACATKNASALEALNSARTHGVEFDAWVFGHFHTPRFHPRRPKILYNGALVPPNGYARSSGYVGELCGQWIFEAVEGFPMGDVRFVEVGLAQDRDTKLGKLVRPFRFELD